MLELICWKVYELLVLTKGNNFKDTTTTLRTHLSKRALLRLFGLVGGFDISHTFPTEQSNFGFIADFSYTRTNQKLENQYLITINLYIVKTISYINIKLLTCAVNKHDLDVLHTKWSNSFTTISCSITV